MERHERRRGFYWAVRTKNNTVSPHTCDAKCGFAHGWLENTYVATELGVIVTEIRTLEHWYGVPEDILGDDL